MLWRDISGKVNYAWYLTGWCSDNDSLRGLDMFLHDYVRGEVEMTNQTTVPQLIDEHWHVGLLLLMFVYKFLLSIHSQPLYHVSSNSATL